MADLTFDEAVAAITPLLGTVIRPHIYLLKDGELIGSLAVDPDVAFAALRATHTGGPMTERLHLSCNTCGHWKVAAFTKEDVADWLRVHPEARIRTALHGMDRQSTCPHPCGTPFVPQTGGPHG